MRKSGRMRVLWPPCFRYARHDTAREKMCGRLQGFDADFNALQKFITFVLAREMDA